MTWCNSLPVAGLYVNGLNVHIRLKVRGYDELPILIFAFGFNLVFNRHFSDPVGFTEHPIVVEFGCRWHSIKVACGCAGFDPVCDHLNLCIRETAFVLEVPVARRRFPRWHQPCLCIHRDFRRPRFRIAVVDECERSDFTLTVAGLALFLEDRRDVFAIGDLVGERGFWEMNCTIRMKPSLERGQVFRRASR